MTDERGRMFPIQTQRGYPKPHPLQISWSIAEEAYSSYVSMYGRCQTLERLAERGGFGPGEMDMFRPGWIEASSEIASLRAENERLREDYDRARRVGEALNEDDDHDGITQPGESLLDALKRVAANRAKLVASPTDTVAERDALRAELALLRESHETIRDLFDKKEREVIALRAELEKANEALDEFGTHHPRQDGSAPTLAEVVDEAMGTLRKNLAAERAAANAERKRAEEANEAWSVAQQEKTLLRGMLKKAEAQVATLTQYIDDVHRAACGSLCVHGQLDAKAYCATNKVTTLTQALEAARKYCLDYGGDSGDPTHALLRKVDAALTSDSSAPHVCGADCAKLVRGCVLKVLPLTDDREQK